MKKIIVVLIVVMVFLTLITCAYADSTIEIEHDGITQEQFDRYKTIFAIGIKEEDVRGLIKSFDIEPDTERICIYYRDGGVQSNWYCVYDKNGNYLYGVKLHEKGESYPCWNNGKLYIFAGWHPIAYEINEDGKLVKIFDCLDVDLYGKNQTRQEVNGVMYRLKKGNIFLPNDYISLVRENDDGSEEVVIRCKHISDGQVVGSTIFSLFIISVILGMMSVFVVVFVKWRRDLRAFFAQKRAEGLSEGEIRRQFAEYQREKNERLRRIFNPR